MVSVAVKVRSYVRIYKMCVFIYTSSKRCICKYRSLENFRPDLFRCKIFLSK